MEAEGNLSQIAKSLEFVKLWQAMEFDAADRDQLSPQEKVFGVVEVRLEHGLFC